MSAGADSLKSILFALGANFLIALAKTGGAAFTGSSSMLAEAIHSYADCVNQGLLLWGLREGRRRPSADHPLGYGKAIYFWSFIVAVMLFSMGGLFSIYEGVHKLSASEPLTHAWVAMIILVFGIVAEAGSLWGCLREVNKDRGRQSLWRWFRESRQSELLVVLAEDIAALGGLVLALVFIGLAQATGNPMWDAAGSISIGVLLILVAVLVGVEVKALLIGQGVEERVLERMRAHLAGDSEVEGVYNLLTQQLGRDVMVAVKAKMRPTASAAALVAAINRVEQRFRSAFPQVQWLFFEPDVED
jgi:cation diffusion facilitator family transporter